jgi:hypothetical protein
MATEMIVLDDSQYPRSAIELAGAQYLGVQESLLAGDRLHLFQDPATRTTLAMLESEISLGSVQERLARAREMFTKERAGEARA